MKKYIVHKGDTLDSIAEQFGVQDGQTLRSYHNIYCPLEDLLGHDVVPGKELFVLEDSQYLKDDDEVKDSINGYDDEAEAEETVEVSEEQQEESKE